MTTASFVAIKSFREATRRIPSAVYLILNGVVNFDYAKENSIYAAVFAGIGLFIYLIGLILSHIFAFEVEDNIIKSSVTKLINKPLGYFDDKESGRIRNVIVSGASETHSFLAHQLPDMAMTIVSPIVLIVFFFMFNWKLGLASMIPMIIGMILMSSMMKLYSTAFVLCCRYFTIKFRSVSSRATNPDSIIPCKLPGH